MRYRKHKRCLASYLVFLTLILLVSGLTACGAGGGGGKTESNTTNQETTGIGHDGGTVTSSDGKAKVVIPAGAITGTANITVTTVSNQPSGNIGTAFEFGPDGTTFSQPLTITISYDEADLSGISEADLKLGKVVNNQWQALNGSSVDTVANIITGTTSSFSTYGVIAVSSTGTFKAAGMMTKSHYNHTSTLLPTGKVLIAGGRVADGLSELFDPGTGIFNATGNMAASRLQHTATLLPNGKVLITGGDSLDPAPVGNLVIRGSAEIYDPATGTFNTTGSMTAQRTRHTATLLPNGKVLLTGGQSYNGNAIVLLASAEIYDPATGTFSVTGNMNYQQADHNATLLPDGKVLISGAVTAELYDPNAGTFTVTGNMTTAHNGHTATLLPEGKVLIAGGGSATTELYDPNTGTFTATDSMSVRREYHAATLLPNSKVLITGGANNGSSLNTAEIYQGIIPTPAAPLGVIATPGNGQVTISWNAVSGATSYNLYMASQSSVTRSNYNTLSGGMAHSNITSPYVHTGLTNGTTYYFVVTAVNTSGESAESSEVSTTPAVSIIIPNAPGSLQTSAVSSTQINLAWADNSANEDGFKIERKTGASGTYSQIGTVTANSTSYSDTAGLAANTVYCYQVRAYNIAGNSGYTNESCTNTLPAATVPDTTPPTVSSTSPTNIATNVAVNTAITATFSETMDASTVTTATFALNNGVTGTVTYSGTTATFTPSGNLAYSTTYTATITTGVKDIAGNAMASNYTWTFTTGTATAATRRMPDTNQTTSYTTTFGEDNDYTINPPSYTDNANFTITDNVTGLIWQKHDDGVAKTWTSAITYCDTLVLGGQTDWRLPSRIELISIVDYGVYTPSINTTYFSSTISSNYWSSTTYAGDTSDAWSVYFGNGYTDSYYKTFSYYVRCVRGG